MSDIFENKLKFKPDYKWPDPEKERDGQLNFFPFKNFPKNEFLMK